jgi:hypothetical protein
MHTHQNRANVSLAILPVIVQRSQIPMGAMILSAEMVFASWYQNKKAHFAVVSPMTDHVMRKTLAMKMAIVLTTSNLHLRSAVQPRDIAIFQILVMGLLEVVLLISSVRQARHVQVFPMMVRVTRWTPAMVLVSVLTTFYQSRQSAAQWPMVVMSQKLVREHRVLALPMNSKNQVFNARAFPMVVYVMIWTCAMEMANVSTCLNPGIRSVGLRPRTAVMSRNIVREALARAL